MGGERDGWQGGKIKEEEADRKEQEWTFLSEVSTGGWRV